MAYEQQMRNNDVFTSVSLLISDIQNCTGRQISEINDRAFNMIKNEAMKIDETAELSQFN